MCSRRVKGPRKTITHTVRRREMMSPGNEMAILGVAASGEYSTDIDHVVSDDRQADPALHAGFSFVTAASQSVPPFHDADATLTASASFLSLAKPAFLLLAAESGILRRPVRDADSLDALSVGVPFIIGRMKGGIARDEAGRPSEDLPVSIAPPSFGCMSGIVKTL